MKTNLASILIRMCGALLSAGQTVILARSMGAGSLGLYAAALALSAFLAIPASAGLGQYLTREVAVARSRMDGSLARGLVRSANKVMLFYAFLSIVLLAGLHMLEIGATGDIKIVVFTGIIVLLSSTDLLRSGAMRGNGSALLSQVPEQVIRPGSFLLLIILQIWHLGQVSVYGALLAYCVAVALSALFGQVALHRQLGGGGPAKVVDFRSTIRRSAGPTALGGVQTLFSNTDVLILSIFGFFVAAGQYKVALLGVVALLFVFAALSAVAVRDLAISLAQRNVTSVIATSDRLTIWGVSVMGVITLVYGVAGATAIEMIFGREFVSAYESLIILSIGHLVSTAFGPTVEISRLLQAQRVSVVLSLVGWAVMVCVSLILIGWSPLMAVSVGTASGHIIRRLLLSCHIQKTLGFDPSLVGAVRRRVS